MWRLTRYTTLFLLLFFFLMSFILAALVVGGLDLQTNEDDEDAALLSRLAEELNQINSSREHTQGEQQSHSSGRQLASSCSDANTLRATGEAKSAFGFKVVFKNNNELLVGAPMQGNGVGRVYHFDKSGAVWNQLNFQSVDQTSPTDKGQFGYEIAISHDSSVAAVGQPGDNASKGAVWIQDYAQPLEFPTFKKVDLPSGSFGNFGYSIAVHPKVLLVAAFEESSIGNGVVFCYVRTSALQAFSHVQTLLQPFVGATAYFGFSIALYPSGSMAMISAPGMNGNEGAVYNYTSTEGINWAYQSATTSVTTDRFGYSLAVNSEGTQLFIGSPSLEGDSNDFIDTMGDKGTYRLTANGAGYSIATDEEGYAVIAGRPNTLSKSGQAERFYLTQPEIDHAVTDFVSTQAGQWAGWSVGMSPSGDHLAVGAPLEVNSGLTGAVYVATCPSKTSAPSRNPSRTPSKTPSVSPTTSGPTASPTTPMPSKSPSHSPATSTPSTNPSFGPTKSPSRTPSTSPTTKQPSKSPTTSTPSTSPSRSPTTSRPSKSPSHSPTKSTSKPSQGPSSSPTTSIPSKSPTTSKPSRSPSKTPSKSPSRSPSTSKPSKNPSSSPTLSPVVATFSPSMAPTVNFDPRCIGRPGMTKAQCSQQNKKICNGVKSPMKWTGRACKTKRGKRADDGGCRCHGFCGYICKGRCNGDKQCYWKNNACYRKGSDLLHGSCEGT